MYNNPQYFQNHAPCPHCGRCPTCGQPRQALYPQTYWGSGYGFLNNAGAAQAPVGQNFQMTLNAAGCQH